LAAQPKNILARTLLVWEMISEVHFFLTASVLTVLLFCINIIPRAC